MPLPLLAGATGTAVKTAVGLAAGEAAGRGLMQLVLNATKSAGDVTSLVDITRPARVEPLCIIDASIADQPYMQDVLKFTLSTYTGYYLQAVNMVLSVDRIETLKVFDALNPYRSDTTRRMGAVFSKETYSDGLPSLEAFDVKIKSNSVAEYSEAKYKASLEAREDEKSTDDNTDDKIGKISSNDGQKVYEQDNLAVGKLVNVEFHDTNGTKNKIPVMIRLIPAIVEPQTITHIFSAGGRDTWLNRMFLVSTGQIRAWRDFVLGQDMIDEHLRVLMNDKSGVYKQITDRRRNNYKQSLRSGVVSLADASHIAVVSMSTIKAASSALYGKIDDYATRKKMFDNSYLMLMVVIDERYERATVYHRGIELSTSHRFDELKIAEKNKGPDITDIFKMFNKSLQTNI